MLVTQITILVYCLVNDVFELWRKLRVQTYWRNGSTVEYGLKDYTRRVTPKWQTTRRHFIKHHPERKHVRSRIQFLAAYLFRRHVGHSAQRRAGAGQVFHAHSRCRIDPHACEFSYPVGDRQHFRQPKIENLCVPTLRHKNIRGLDVAMNNSLRMSRIKGIRNVDS